MQTNKEETLNERRQLKHDNVKGVVHHNLLQGLHSKSMTSLLFICAYEDPDPKFKLI